MTCDPECPRRSAVPALVPQLLVICDVTSQASPVQESHKDDGKDSHTSNQGGR